MQARLMCANARSLFQQQKMHGNTKNILICIYLYLSDNGKKLQTVQCQTFTFRFYSRVQWFIFSSTFFFLVGRFFPTSSWFRPKNLPTIKNWVWYISKYVYRMLFIVCLRIECEIIIIVFALMSNWLYNANILPHTIFCWGILCLNFHIIIFHLFSLSLSLNSICISLVLVSFYRLNFQTN